MQRIFERPVKDDSFVVRPSKVPTGATVIVQVLRSEDGRSLMVGSGAVQTSDKLHWIGCGPNGAPTP